MSRFLLGVDVGGTFTDFVACDRETHAVSAWKNLTVPDDPTTGILRGLGTLDAGIFFLRERWKTVWIT